MASFWPKIKHHASALAFIAGFIWDNRMLTRIDHVFANVMLGSYLSLSAISIIVINMPTGTRWHQKIIEKAARWLPLILQFCFGSLFSAYIVFYTRSASLTIDWPFLLLLVILVVSNELLRKRYLEITLPLSLFFIVLFSYSIFSLPILVGTMGSEIFITSGIISLLVTFLLALLLSRIAPERLRKSRRSLILSVILIYVLFNFAYFTNIIPPVPLSLKEIGVYHTVTRESDGTYDLTFEPGAWYPFLSKTADVLHLENNEPAYVWSSVFAPTKLTIPLFYRWQYFDATTQTWVATDLIQFSIVGGRDDGFRGYSMKSNVFPGQWRVDVETAGKDIVGRVEFSVEGTSTPLSNLITETS